MAETFDLFDTLPLELQGMVAVEALRRPGVNYIKVTQGMDESGLWMAWLRPFPSKSDASSYLLADRLYNDVGIVFKKAIRAATKDQKSFLTLHVGNITRTHVGITFKMNSDTELIFLDFGRGLSPDTNPQIRWYQYDDPSRGNLGALRHTFAPLQKVAVEYRLSWKSCVGWKVTTPFQCWCADPERHHHQIFKMCPRELVFVFNSFPNLKEFFFVVRKSSGKGKTPDRPLQTAGSSKQGTCGSTFLLIPQTRRLAN